MSNQSSSLKTLCQALFLIAAIMFQSLAVPGRDVVFAKAVDTEMKTAGSPDADPQRKSAAPTQSQRAPAPNAPQAAVIAATLTDNITAATKVAPGANINYSATITNNGAASPADDATNLNFSAPLDANTTLVPGTIHASPLAVNETYDWVGNTFLDTSARALPSVTANDVAVNAPGGTDTFTVTTIAGGATALGGVVSLAASGHYTYTPPLGRPNTGDGATVQDSFTYTIKNSADASLTSTGTVKINLTGRVWYLQAGAAGDGRSNTPSGSPAAMSTAADKSTDIFYIFSNAGSLNGVFTLENGQQLLGQGVNLVANSITLFTAAAPTPTTTNTGAGNCVALASGNTLSGFNIGDCTASAILGNGFGTLTLNTVSVNNTVASALDLTTGTANATFGTLSGKGVLGAANAVRLSAVGGTTTATGGSLTGTINGSDVVQILSGTTSFTYPGTITNNGGGKAVLVQTESGSGTLNFSGLITDASAAPGQGILMSGNSAGTTVNFSGGMNISTTGNSAFAATGGGTVTATQNNTSIVNTLTSTTAAALNVANTTIGASNLTFRSITAGTAGSGPTNGILLSSTGASGGLMVVGNGSAGTGGTIQKTTGASVSLTSTKNVSLSFMNIQNSTMEGILGTGVDGFTLISCSVTGNSTAGNNRDGIKLTDTVNAATFTSDTVTGNFNSNVQLTTGGASTAAMTTLTVTNGTYSSSTQNAGFLVDLHGTASLATASVSGATFSGNFSKGIQFQHNDNATMGNGVGSPATGTITVDNCTFTNNDVQASFESGGNGNGSAYYRFTNNATITGAHSLAVNFANGATVGTGTFKVFCDNNHIGTNNVPNSGSLIGEGIRAFLQGSQTATVTITNNVIRALANATSGSGSFGARGIDVEELGNSNANTGQTRLDVKITGNDVNQQYPVPPDSQFNIQYAIVVIADGQGTGTSGSNVNAEIHNNTVPTQSPCEDSPCSGTAESMIWYETAANVSGARTATLYNASADASVNAAIINRNTGTAGKSSATQSGAGQPAVTLTNTQPNTVARLLVPASGSNENFTAVVTKRQAIEARPVTATPITQASTKVGIASVTTKATTKATAAEVARIYRSERPLSNHAVRRNSNASAQKQNAPTSVGVSLNTIATFPAAGKSITIKYSATVNTPPLARSVQTQGTVTANAGGISVNTTDPETGTAVPTKTNIDTTMTWNGATSTDWNTATNWTQPAGGTQYAPGVSNPAVNDVVIPNVGAQPNISATDIGVFSLSIANGRTLTITNPRVLTIGGSPGGDLTLDGIISGGNLNLGTGTHVINNAGATGSLSSTNVATVISGSTVTVNNNLQAGAFAVNAGGSMIITNRTLSLNGSGAALAVPGGATFTTTGSTVIFNGTAAQQAAGIAYNNLTINNTIGLNVTGVTLTGNATVNGVLTLTSSDLDTGVFTLTQPNTTASTGVSDVVGTVSRTGGPFAPATILTFGNPNNQISFTAAGTKPSALSVLIAKAAPATYAAAVQRNYTITPTGGAGFTATLRLHYLDSELNGNVEANLNLRRGPSWSAVLPSTRDTAANWVECNAVTAFSQWTFSALAPTASLGAVTGRIVDSNGRPVEGAVVRLSGGQSRKMITDANGNYTFDNVETGELYTVTPSRANFNFNPFNRTFTQVGNKTEAAFTGTSMGDNANPVDTAEYFVRQQYVDTLGREPDEAGFNYWSDKINQCLSAAAAADLSEPGAVATGSANVNDCMSTARIDVAAAFFISDEYQATGSYIYDVYAGALGRRPGFGEYTADRTQVVGGATLDAAKTVFAQNFVQRPEFMTKYQNAVTAESFVDALLQSAQAAGVNLNADRDGLIAAYNDGASLNNSRAAVVRLLADNATFKQSQYNQAFVLTEYFAYLRRDIDQRGYDFWLGVLNTGDAGNYRGMVCSFVTATEYQHRFSQIASRSNSECGQ